MYLLLTDETNKDASSEVKFFVYGGLFFRADVVKSLHDGISSIRNEYGFAKADRFKFDSNSKPPLISASDFSSAKNKVLKLCVANDCRFIAYVVHHQIAKNQKDKIEFAADHVLGRFQQFLSEVQDQGLCLVDPLPGEKSFNYLRGKFQKGIGNGVQLDRILLFGESPIGCSHLSSAMDIVLGAFRYCINHPLNDSAAKTIFSEILKLLWKAPNGDFVDKGLMLRPKIVKVKEYKADFQKLIQLMKNHAEGT